MIELGCAFAYFAFIWLVIRAERVWLKECEREQRRDVIVTSARVGFENYFRHTTTTGDHFIIRAGDEHFSNAN